MRITVTKLGHLGDGVAEGPIFVPGALPGEQVEGEVIAGRMDAPKIVTPSPERVKAPCPHYRACGGCALMHVRDGFVAEWKAGVVRDALAAQGLAAPIRKIVASPPFARRRAVFSGRRTRAGGAVVGFHARASASVVAVPECRVIRPALRAAFPALEAVTRAGASRSGELHLALTETRTGLDLAVTGGKPLDAGLRAELARIAEANGFARIAWAEEIAVLRAPPRLAFGPALAALPPGGFLQATAEGEAALLASVREAVAGARRIADLFAGAGTFALPLAETAEVYAAEGDEALAEALGAAWRATPGLKRLTAETRDLFRRPLLPDELTRFDVVVLDPPRAGAEAQTEALARSGVARIAYVSCNPITFSRDARALAAGGYRIDWIDIVDQFRWSPHVELAAQISKGDTAQDGSGASEDAGKA